MKSVNNVNGAAMEARLREVHQLRAQAEEKKAELFETAIKKELFPADKIPARWVEATAKAIRKTAPVQLRMSLMEFAEVVGCKVVTCGDGNSVSLFEFGSLTNSLECVSPEVLGFTDEDYKHFMSTVVTAIELFKTKSKEIRIEGDKKIDDELAMKLASLTQKNSKNPVAQA